jgi:hypothetical protein
MSENVITQLAREYRTMLEAAERIAALLPEATQQADGRAVEAFIDGVGYAPAALVVLARTELLDALTAAETIAAVFYVKEMEEIQPRAPWREKVDEGKPVHGIVALRQSMPSLTLPEAKRAVDHYMKHPF